MQNYVTGEVIRSLREKRRLTQRDLAQRLNVSDKTISKWETGGSLRGRYHINPTLTFAQPIQPEGWITRKGGIRPVEG